MVQYKYVYWCIRHQQYVAAKARRKLRDQLRCKIVKLNLTLLRHIDFHIFSTWIESEFPSEKHDVQARISSMAIPRRAG